MKNRWQNSDAAVAAAQSEVELRVYSSQLLGADSSLVLHGGGNTSVKAPFLNVFGEAIPALYVKGSGWDLRTIKAPGFPPVDLAYLQRLGQLQHLSDSDMMRELRLALLDPKGPTPSVEAILHALIPHKYVDHSHADAVVTLSNTPDGDTRLADLYGDEVLILPYVMPGFILAQQVAEATASINWDSIKGIVLLHHGIFTFHEDAEQSYSNMTELVTRAEEYLAANGGSSRASSQSSWQASDAEQVATLRKHAGTLLGSPLLVRTDISAPAAGFAALENAAELLQRGPLTPDHTIHAKPFGAIFKNDLLAGLAHFSSQYQSYFDSHSADHHQRLDRMPRYGVWLGKGLLYLAANNKRLQIVADISQHTIAAIQQGEALGGWTALPRQDLFDVEYWELEQAKLKSAVASPELEGKIALVTGAASGIGAACVAALAARGAVVLALDISFPAADAAMDGAALALQCDITDDGAIASALLELVRLFGGLDLLVSNAGSFPASAAIAEMDDARWQQSLDINLSAHMKLLRACAPYLSHGFDPAVVFVGSKNVPAPGPGAAAYSVAKAGLAQLARIAALEWGSKGIRVNTVHPNAVYDTAIWTNEVLASRAAHYGVSVEEYKRSNVLGTELQAADVAETVAALLGSQFDKTTGAQIPVDGGNDRVI